MLTDPSSAVLPFQPNPPAPRKGSFEAWRESWVRAVFADENLWGSDKSVAAFLALHLNRETRACYPSYATIGRGLCIDRLNARRSIKRLITRGYLLRKPRGRGQSNLYSPAEGVVIETTGVVTVTTEVWSPKTPRTSDLTSERTLREDVVIMTTGKKEESGLPKEASKQEPTEGFPPSVVSPSSAFSHPPIPRGPPHSRRRAATRIPTGWNTTPLNGTWLSGLDTVRSARSS